LLPLYGFDIPQTSFPKAREAAQQALALAPGLAEAHIARAEVYFYFDWDFPSAERDFRRGLELKPNYATGRQWYGEFLSYMGRHEEAINELQAARRLDPDSFIIDFDLGKALYYARKYDQAIEQFSQMLARESRFNSAHGFVCACTTQKGNAEAAIAAVEKTLANSGGAGAGRGRPAYLGVAYARAGDRQKAREILDELQLSGRKYVPPTEPAMVYAALQENDAALAALERGFHERSNEMVSLKVEPMFDSLRQESRFQKILADMRFPP
jgi:tetratricopeptide (TPR) repeat protein